MARSTTLTTTSEQAVVVKLASGLDAKALEAEGERLRSAAHPGVVEVVSSAGSEAEWELRLVHAGRPLSSVGALPVEQVAAITAAVAATLADLHDAGIVHGRIDATHVLLGAHGRPVLCGFGSGIPSASPGDDVAAVGNLMVELLAGVDEMEPIPERRWRRRSHWKGWVRRSLLTIADQACAEPATRRPTARRLAASIADSVPGAGTTGALAIGAGDASDQASVASLSAEDDPLGLLRRTAQYEDGSRRQLSAIACAVIGVALLAAGGMQLGGGSSDTPPPAPLAAPVTTSVTTSVTSVRTSAPARVVGNLVFNGQHRFEVGEAGDVVVVGDWDCDGMATPAALRPASGEVFIFPSWTDDEDLVVRAHAVVEGATGLEVERGSAPDAGCDTLVALRGQAGPLAIKVGRRS